ncbi:MAG: 4Fe-4S dicluster domain-containing protein [Planctomycetota bacterium]|jgi:Fe-S-cluster-containing hydrogenase component 2
MAKMILIDQQACTGCRQCELVCSVHHTGTADPARSRITMIKWESQGFYLPVVCQQCLEPACATVCPVNAIGKERATDRVLVDYDRCIGCKMCVMACPFGAMSLDPHEGRVIKCDLCDGEPTCVSFCEADALKFVEAGIAHLSRQRASGSRLAALIGTHR